MFTHLHAVNYRCLMDMELSFDPLTVLAGPNGSGKSAVLRLISELRDFVLGRRSSLELFPLESLTRWDVQPEQRFSLEIQLPEGHYRYLLRLSHDRKEAENRLVEEKLECDDTLLFHTASEKTRLFHDQGGKGEAFMPDWHISGISRVHQRKENTKLVAFRTFLQKTLVLAPNPGLVSAVHEGARPVLTPRLDCSDFAGWLIHVGVGDIIARTTAEKNLAEGALTSFRGFQFPPRGDAHVVECVFSGTAGIWKFRLDELSSGQIVLIILEIAMSVASQNQATLLLDEPGNFLQLGEIQPLLARIEDSAAEGRYQTILTAHHPLAVDFLAASHGQWLERAADGATRAQRIHVASSVVDGSSHLRISDVVARGWLSGLGVQSPSEVMDSEAVKR